VCYVRAGCGYISAGTGEESKKQRRWKIKRRKVETETVGVKTNWATSKPRVEGESINQLMGKIYKVLEEEPKAKVLAAMLEM